MKLWTPQELEEEMQKVAWLDTEGATVQLTLDTAVESDPNSFNKALKEESEGLCTVLYDRTPEGLSLELDWFSSLEDVLEYLTDYMVSVEYDSEGYWIVIQQ